MLGRASSPRRGDKAGPRRGSTIPAAVGARKGVEAGSQHKTALCICCWEGPKKVSSQGLEPTCEGTKLGPRMGVGVLGQLRIPLLLGSALVYLAIRKNRPRGMAFRPGPTTSACIRSHLKASVRALSALLAYFVLCPVQAVYVWIDFH